MRIVIIVRSQSTSVRKVDDSEAKKRRGNGRVWAVHEDGNLLIEGSKDPGSVVEPGEGLNKTMSES